MPLKHLTQAQIATANFPYVKHSLDDTLDSLQRIGVPAIELQATYPHLCLDDITAADRRALAKKLRDRGLHCICVTPEVMNSPINIAATAAADRARSIAYIQRAIDCAHELEAPYIQMHVGYATVDECRAEAWRRSAASMRALADYALRRGVTITSEYSYYTWKSVMNSSKDLRRMIDEVGSPAYQGMSDTVVMVKIPESIDDVAQNLGSERLKHFHFTDGIGDATSSLHMIPGEGRLDLDHVLEVLDDMRYTGYLSLELQGCENTPHEAMEQAVRWMRAHLPQ